MSLMMQSCMFSIQKKFQIGITIVCPTLVLVVDVLERLQPPSNTALHLESMLVHDATVR